MHTHTGHGPLALLRPHKVAVAVARTTLTPTTTSQRQMVWSLTHLLVVLETVWLFKVTCECRMVVVTGVVDGASSTAVRPAPSDGIGREAR